jgi:hypothetical protein
MKAIFRGLMAMLGLAGVAILAGCSGGGPVSGGGFGTGGGGGGGSFGGAQDQGSVRVLLTDAPLDSVSAFKIDITGATVTNTSGNQVALTAPFQSIEVRNLALAATLMFESSKIPAGNYTGLRLIFSNPQLILTDSLGRNFTARSNTTPSVTLARSSVDVPITLNVTKNGFVAVLADFRVADSVTLNTQGNYSVDPQIRVTATSPTSPILELEDTLGRIASLPATPAGSMDLVLLVSGAQVRVVTDATTQFSPEIGSFSSLSTGQVVEVDAKLQSDGTFLARFIDVTVSDPALRYQGVVTRVVRDAFGNFVFDVVVQK